MLDRHRWILAAGAVVCLSTYPGFGSAQTPCATTLSCAQAAVDAAAQAQAIASKAQADTQALAARVAQDEKQIQQLTSPKKLCFATWVGHWKTLVPFEPASTPDQCLNIALWLLDIGAVAQIDGVSRNYALACELSNGGFSIGPDVGRGKPPDNSCNW
jgi:hypothetical protein